MSEKTASGLIAYCKAQLGRPYWMGTFGQIASAGIYQSNKKRLARYYTAADFPRQYGQRVHDCIGLIKGYLWSDGPDAAPRYLSGPLRIDLDADGMYYKCGQHGQIHSMPDTPGTLVFILSGGRMVHVGVYIGGGQVIEARGHAYGVVQTALKGRGWTHWGVCPYITYDSANGAESEDEDMVRYARLTDVPNNYGFRDIINTLMTAEIIKGDGSDPNGNNDVIDLSQDQVRSLVFEYRGGAFDRALIARGMSPVINV